MLKRTGFLLVVLVMLAMSLPLVKAQQPTLTPDPALTAADYMTRGDQAMERRNYRGAVTEYSFVIQLEPENVDAYLKRAQAYIAQNTLDLALADYQQAATIAPQNGSVFFAMGQLQEQLGNSEAALAAYDQAIAADSALTDAYIAKADLLLAQENDAAALETTTAGLENGENAVLLRQRGWAQLGLEDYEAAGEDFERAIALATEETQDALAYAGRALVYAFRTESNLEQALVDAEQAIALDRQNAWAYYSRGYVYALQGEYQRAVNDFGQAIRLNQNFADAYLQRAEAYIDLESYRQALTDVQRLITLRTEGHDYYRLAAIYNQVDGNEWRAVEAGMYALELGLSPEEIARTNLQIGYAYHNLRGFENAIVYYTRVVEDENIDNPNLARAYLNRGIANWALENREQAVADYNAAIAANPDNPVPLLRLGYMAEEDADYGESLRYYRLYVALLEELGEPRNYEIEQSIREYERMGVGELMDVPAVSEGETE